MLKSPMVRFLQFTVSNLAITPEIFFKVPKNPAKEEQGFDLEYLPEAMKTMVSNLADEDLKLEKGAPLVIFLARSAERVIAVTKYALPLLFSFPERCSRLERMFSQ